MKLAFLSVFLFLAAALHAESFTVRTVDVPTLGAVLTDAKGMTLYIFGDDKPEMSNCYGDCTTTWPPLLTNKAPTLAPGIPGKLRTILRKDGKQQVTYDGRPLYYYSDDKSPGEARGHGLENKWSVVVPTRN